MRILPDVSSAVYVPSALAFRTGYLLFRRESTLMAAPFHPEKLQITGEVFPVAEQLATVPVAYGPFPA